MVKSVFVDIYILYVRINIHMPSDIDFIYAIGISCKIIFENSSLFNTR